MSNPRRAARFLTILRCAAVTHMSAASDVHFLDDMRYLALILVTAAVAVGALVTPPLGQTKHEAAARSEAVPLIVFRQRLLIQIKGRCFKPLRCHQYSLKLI